MQLQSASPFFADAFSLIFGKQHAEGRYRGGHLFSQGLQKFMEDTKVVRKWGVGFSQSAFYCWEDWYILNIQRKTLYNLKKKKTKRKGYPRPPAGWLRFKPWNLAHPSCQSLVNRVCKWFFKKFSGFHQSASFTDEEAGGIRVSADWRRRPQNEL